MIDLNLEKRLTGVNAALRKKKLRNKIVRGAFISLGVIGLGAAAARAEFYLSDYFKDYPETISGISPLNENYKIAGFNIPTRGDVTEVELLPGYHITKLANGNSQYAGVCRYTIRPDWQFGRVEDPKFWQDERSCTITLKPKVNFKPTAIYKPKYR